MQYGICHLSIVPLRASASHESEMTSQLLYGEYFKVLEERAHWSRIRNVFDGFEAWIDKKQYTIIEESEYYSLNEDDIQLSSDLIEYITDDKGLLMPIPLGSVINFTKILGHKFEGEIAKPVQVNKGNLINTAILYLNSPHICGGKTPFGIDCSGFTQTVYKLNGYQIKRTAAEQSKQGEALSFIEESEPGDLAFFDDNEGIINHVGLMMKDNYIIHVDGKVRIDRIDHSGIFNAELKKHTHKLRVIKKII
ncbi:C40 family peptidase [Christiangramia forsetii]|uniref:NlpC/P60 family protein n=2 Tax=Christiangramia forsetii TaxID=411153 RepID=A0M1I4_CHRFK|nr:C40 family peptidase [Christiangramia forsetii]GGG42454.1 hydrolase Nlp/P60 [Christiangramia forsetii]CAL66479.1 NlpC/P60 family protein [Christiangramia forsetii KT0803]